MRTITTNYLEEQGGGIKQIIYYNDDGLRHNTDDKPAHICYYPNGKILKLMYYTNDKLHRGNNKPAHIVYNKKGKIELEVYYTYGQIQKRLVYYPNGNIKSKIVYTNDGMYEIEYSSNGYIETHKWYNLQNTLIKSEIIDIASDLTKPCRD